jgi:hypothetical protein
MDNEASSFSFDAIIFLFLSLTPKECIHATQRTTRGWGISKRKNGNMNE